MRQLRSYIVRIYRQGARSLTGAVEDRRSGAQRHFDTVETLSALLRKRTFGTRARARSGWSAGKPGKDEP